MRLIAVILLSSVVGIAGCGTDAGGKPEAGQEVRPAFQAGPAAGELFEGPIRVHTRGMQGDALGCDIAPLGDLVAFSWNDHQEEPKIYVVPAKGGPPRQITFGAWPDIDPEFAPAGDPATYRIAFASRREGNFDIYLVSLAGTGGAWQLTGDPSDELHPSFSPDGRHLAFARLDTDGVWKIWRKDLTTQQETHLGPGTNPEWSPTGEAIAFQLPAGREHALWSVWVMRSDGGTRTQVVADDAYGAVHPTWSPDGRHIAFAKIPLSTSPGPLAGHVWAYDMKTGASFKLTTTASFDTDPCWALDGWVYFSSTRTTGRFNLLSGRLAPGLLASGIAEMPLAPEGGTP